MPNSKKHTESEGQRGGSAEGPQKTEANTEPLFDLDRLRITQDFTTEIGLQKHLSTIKTRKPHREEFFRVHPDEAYTLTTGLLEVKEDRETYLVDPELRSELPGEIQVRKIFLAVTRQATPYLWPVRLPSPDGRHDDWSRSALDAADLAKHRWIKMVANMANGAYDIYEADGKIPEPEWPAQPFSKLVDVAFRDNFIRSMDHPVVKRLLGMV